MAISVPIRIIQRSELFDGFACMASRLWVRTDSVGSSGTPWGSNEAALSTEFRCGLRVEIQRANALQDPAQRVAYTTWFLGAAQVELTAVAEVRLDAVSELHDLGASYEVIAGATGLSKTRVAQLVSRARSRST